MLNNIPSKARSFWPKGHQRMSVGKGVMFQQEHSNSESSDRSKKLPINKSSNHQYSFPSNSYGERSIAGQPSVSFEELNLERAYLLSTLQREDVKATELLKKITNLQETLDQGMVGPPRNRCKKQLEWLRNRMSETTRQEKSILSRLGQVTFEIQNQERWIRIEEERAMLRGMYHMQLDASRPEFTPENNYGFQCPQGLEAGFYPPAQVPIHAFASELPVPDNHQQSPTETIVAQDEFVAASGMHIRSSSMEEGTRLTESDRRFSMPVFSSDWLGERRGSGPQYLGYYIGT